MLNEKQVKALSPREHPYIIADCDGLYIKVYPSGLKTWIVRERLKDTSGTPKELRKTLGGYPEMSLYHARVAHIELKESLRSEKEKAERLLSSPSFKELAEDYLERNLAPRVTEKHCHKVLSRLERFVYPSLGSCQAGALTAQDVLAVIRNIEAHGYYETAHDVLQSIGQILRYGISCGTVARDVTQDLRGALCPVQSRHMSSLTQPDDIAGLLRAIQTLPAGSVKRLLLFNAYTFVRPSEARLATWSEFDLEKREWRIPAERMKMRRPHRVYLSDQVMEILKESLSVYGNSSGWVFPALRTRSRPLSDMAGTAALRRLGYAGSEMSVHGFRSMASTTLYEAGWNGTAIERQLAHGDRNSVRAAYNYAEYMPVRRVMLQWYADYLDALRDGRKMPNVPEQTRL